MFSGSSAGSAKSPRIASIAPAMLAAFALFVACFDSDEKPVPLVFSTSTSGAVIPPGTTSTTTGVESTSSGEPEVTCRDAIDCVVGCATELQISMLPEPDLTCFLTCEERLTVGEALHLFRLTECVTNRCIDLGVCDKLVPSESSSSDGGSSSSGGSSSGTTGGGGDEGDGTECIDCILANMLDPAPPGCIDLANACV
ncbi:MAG: hypothetical protein AAF799_10825 [Myxococcota bacterium]